MTADVIPIKPVPHNGFASTSDAEALAIVLGNGGGDATVIAAGLLSRAGGLDGLKRMGAADLERFPGIGPARAARIRAALELAVRLGAQPLNAATPIRSSRDVFSALRSRLRGEAREHFIAIALDARNRPVAEITVAIGGLSSCAVSPADCFREIVRESAGAVIFVHNHPSGECAPSDEDVALT